MPFPSCPAAVDVHFGNCGSQDVVSSGGSRDLVRCPYAVGVRCPCWLPVSLGDVAPNPRILVFEFVGIQHSTSPWAISRLFFMFSETTSGQDALHTVLNSGFVHTLPKEQASTVQQILYRGVMTPSLLPVRPGLHSTDVGLFLSVSLSLSFTAPTCQFARHDGFRLLFSVHALSQRALCAACV